MAGLIPAMEVRATTPAGAAGYRHVGDYVMSASHHIYGIQGVKSADNPSLETCQAVCDGREDCKGFSRRKPERVASWCQFYNVTMQQAQADGSLVPNSGFDYYEKVGTEAPVTDTGGGSDLTDFTQYTGRLIDREDRESIVGSPAECAAACRDRPWCRSFEKHRMMARGTCHLSEKIPGDAGVRVVDGNWDLYVRDDAVAVTADTADRTLEADRKEVREGDLVQVYVRLKNPAGVANMNYELRYDPAVARPEGSVVAGNLLRGKALFQANPAERGLIRIGFAGAEGLDQDGSVTVIPFRAVGAPGTRTSLALATPVTEDAQGRALSITRMDGAIEITAPGGGTGGTSLPDCNNDGAINTFDADCALQVSVGLRPASLAGAGADPLRLDVDQNNEVTSGDARLIQQRVRDGVYRR